MPPRKIHPRSAHSPISLPLSFPKVIYFLCFFCFLNFLAFPNFCQAGHSPTPLKALMSSPGSTEVKVDEEPVPPHVLAIDRHGKVTWSLSNAAGQLAIERTGPYAEDCTAEFQGPESLNGRKSQISICHSFVAHARTATPPGIGELQGTVTTAILGVQTWTGRDVQVDINNPENNVQQITQATGTVYETITTELPRSNRELFFFFSGPGAAFNDLANTQLWTYTIEFRNGTTGRLLSVLKVKPENPESMRRVNLTKQFSTDPTEVPEDNLFRISIIAQGSFKNAGATEGHTELSGSQIVFGFFSPKQP